MEAAVAAVATVALRAAPRAAGLEDIAEDTAAVVAHTVAEVHIALTAVAVAIAALDTAVVAIVGVAAQKAIAGVAGMIALKALLILFSSPESHRLRWQSVPEEGGRNQRQG
jgi:hypothetical protein